MPVDSKHPDYTSKIARWRKQRDAYGGEDTVKSALSISESLVRTADVISTGVVPTYTTGYLSKPEGFSDRHWARYVQRAKWYGATRRTLGGYTGAVFQKPIEVIGSRRFEEHTGNITLSGISLDQFAHTVLRDQLLIGRYGVLLEYSDELARPYWCGFPAERIINWKMSDVRGVHELSMIVLQEQSSVALDPYESEYREQYRVAYLNDNGFYQVDVYEIEGSGTRRNAYLKESYIPERRREPLDFIPFQFFGIEGLTSDVASGPLDDLVDTNFAYFRHSADYEHGLYLTGLPTPVVTGHDNPDDVLLIGSLTAWILPEPEAKAYYLEYQGMGLESHERAMDNDKVEMATLGARLLEEQPEVQETLGAVQLRHAGDTGNLKSIANLTSEGLSMLARLHHWWAGETDIKDDPSVMIKLNTDLASTRMKPQDLQALLQAWQSGGMSRESYLWNLQQGELLPPGVTVEEEMARIDTEAPARLPFGDVTEDEPESEEIIN